MYELSTNTEPEQVLPSGIDDGQRHRLLADARRETALEAIAHLRESTTETTLGELASAIDRLEPTGDGDANDARRQALVVDLHHVHLPMLDDVGVVDYRPERKLVVFPDESDRSAADH